MQPLPEGSLPKRAESAPVRTAAESDLPRLAELDRKVFRDEAYPFFVLRQLFEIHGDHLLVVGGDDSLSGYALAAKTTDGKRSWLIGLAVDARHRRCGYGRKLLAEVLRVLAADGVGDLMLSVEPDNQVAIRLYRSFGFVTVARRPHYFGPGGDRLIMSVAVS